jgi:hypothetical protein
VASNESVIQHFFIAFGCGSPLCQIGLQFTASTMHCETGRRSMQPTNSWYESSVSWCNICIPRTQRNQETLEKYGQNLHLMIGWSAISIPFRVGIVKPPFIIEKTLPCLG